MGIPVPVVTPVLLSSNTDARWAPFKLSREFEFTLLGGNDHINRLHLVSARLNPSRTPTPAQVPLRNVDAHDSSAHHETLTRDHSFTSEYLFMFSERWRLQCFITKESVTFFPS